MTILYSFLHKCVVTTPAFESILSNRANTYSVSCQSFMRLPIKTLWPQNGYRINCNIPKQAWYAMDLSEYTVQILAILFENFLKSQSFNLSLIVSFDSIPPADPVHPAHTDKPIAFISRHRFRRRLCFLRHLESNAL